MLVRSALWKGLVMSELLIGTWMGSFSSFVRDLPPDTKPIPADATLEGRPPQLAAYYLDPASGVFTQTKGYYVASSILCLRFLAANKLAGSVKINRGGRLHNVDEDVTGKYDRAFNSTLGVHEGTFTTFFGGPSGIQTEYLYYMRDLNELEYIWWTSKDDNEPHRANVARGTLRRVVLVP